MIQRAPISGGSQGDQATCTSTGKSIASDVNGKLQSASIISGPLGRTCQIHTELNVMREGGLPNETWLMTCNHPTSNPRTKIRLENPSIVRSSVAAFTC